MEASGTGTMGFASPCASPSPSPLPSGGSKGPPTITTGGMKNGGSNEGSVLLGGPSPIITGGTKGVGSEGGSKGASETSGGGSFADVFPGGTSDITKPQSGRDLQKFRITSIKQWEMFPLFVDFDLKSGIVEGN